ncbi:hypothetical protein ANTPLA_LOCUS6260 [Anthophora plagiata]
MLESNYVEESTSTKLAPSLEQILEELNAKVTPHDYIIALAIVLLNEADFYILKNKGLSIYRKTGSLKRHLCMKYGKRTYSLTVQTLKYFNPFWRTPSEIYKNLKEISHRFKDALSTPVRSDVLINAGLIGPSLQAIPTELKLKILGMLDAYSLTRMAQCSSEFNMLCSEPQLWKDLVYRDFPQHSCEKECSKECYRASIKRY